jgi:hypothetical protein
VGADCPGKLIKVQTRERKQVIHELVEELKNEKKPAAQRDLPSSQSKRLVFFLLHDCRFFFKVAVPMVLSSSILSFANLPVLSLDEMLACGACACLYVKRIGFPTCMLQGVVCQRSPDV